MPGELLRKDIGHIALKLWGGPYERGIAHGTLLRDEIADLAQALPKFIRKTVSVALSRDPESKLTKSIGSLVEWYLHRASQKFSAFLPRWAQEELEGIAAGAKQEKTTILLINTFDDILVTDRIIRMLGKITPSCSGVALRGNGGQFLYGFNLDYFILTEEIARHATVFLTKQNHGKIVSFGPPGFIGAVRGMNAKGLVAGYLTSPCHQKKSKGIPTAILVREILEKCAAPNDAARYLQCNLPMQGVNILVGNAEETLVVECTPYHLRTIEPSSDRPTQSIAVTNHYRTELSKFQQRPRIPSCLSLPQQLMSEEFSRERLDVIQRMIIEHPEYDLNDIQKILGNRKICHDYTAVSCLFNPSSLQAVLVDNGGRRPASQGRQYPYCLEEYWV